MFIRDEVTYWPLVVVESFGQVVVVVVERVVVNATVNHVTVQQQQQQHQPISRQMM